MLSMIKIKCMEMLRDTNALKYHSMLMKSQWFSQVKLLEIQKEKLIQTANYCYNEVPFYKKIFDKNGINPQNITIEDLQKLPLMSKEIVKENFEDLKSKSFKKWHPRMKNTSGSTGKPFNYYLDKESHTYEWAHIWRGWAVGGYKPGDLYASLSGGSLIPEEKNFKQRMYLALCNSIHLPTYHLNEKLLNEYTKKISNSKIKLLYGYPSCIETLANHCTKNGLKIDLKSVITVSECLAPSTRNVIKKAFNCDVFDTYGCNDGGIYSFECNHHCGYHIGMETCFVEIVDSTGRHVKDGEIGNIVVSNLAMRAMPLLRYNTGDIGAINRSICECGRGLIRIEKLQGRERDVIICPDGRKVHGAFFNHFQPFYQTDWLERFQIYQPSLEKIVLRLKVKYEPDEHELNTILEELRKGLGDLQLNVEYVENMHLSRTGKFNVVTSDLTKNLNDESLELPILQ